MNMISCRTRQIIAARLVVRSCESLCLLGRVVERGLVGAASAEREHERAGLHVDAVAEELTPLAVVARDDAGDRLRLGHRLAHADLDLATRPEPAAPRRVVDVYVERLHAERVCILEDPGELLSGRAPEAARQHVGHRLPLPFIATRVDEQGVRPGRAGVVVVVAERQHGAHAGHVQAADPPLLDDPRERAEALPVSGAPAGPASDPAAGADRLAVARLEVAAGDTPRHGIQCADSPGLSPARSTGFAAAASAGVRASTDQRRDSGRVDGGISEALLEALAPARVDQTPAKLALRLRVRGPADLGEHRGDGFARRESSKPGGDTPWRLSPERLREQREPDPDRGGLVVGDVVDARSAALDRSDGRDRGIVY